MNESGRDSARLKALVAVADDEFVVTDEELAVVLDPVVNDGEIFVVVRRVTVLWEDNPLVDDAK